MIGASWRLPKLRTDGIALKAQNSITRRQVSAFEDARAV